MSRLSKGLPSSFHSRPIAYTEFTNVAYRASILLSIHTFFQEA